MRLHVMRLTVKGVSLIRGEALIDAERISPRNVPINVK